MARPKVYTDQTQPYSLTIRIPRDLFDQMERYTGRHGRSRTEAIVEGLKLWLDRQASSKPLSHNNNNAVMHELTTPAHFLDDGIPFDDDHVPVPAPATAAVADILHDNNTVMQEQPAVPETAPTFDAETFYLGDICSDEPERHQYATSGKSVRYRDGDVCRGCAIAEKQTRQRTKASTTGSTKASKRKTKRQATAL